MQVNKFIYEGCYEIQFFDEKTGNHLDIVLEKGSGFFVFVTDMINKPIVQDLPDEVFEMFKDEYKLERPEVVLPPLEEIEPLPWE